MKKLLCLLFVFCFLFSAVACSTVEDDVTPTDTQADDTTADPTEDTTEPEEEETTGPKIPDGKKLNILFIGNSLVFYNDMPLMFESIAKSEGKDVYVASQTQGSTAIAAFADETTALGKTVLGRIKSRKWDYIIIEPSRAVTSYENTAKDYELEGAKKIKALADSIGAKVMLYSVWGNNTGSVKEYHMTGPSTREHVATHPLSRKEHTQYMHDLNQEFAQALGGVEVAIAGYAFENSIAKYPEINVYHTDEAHPSLEGSYLAACVFYNTIYGQPVTDKADTKDIATAAKLKEIANDTVLGNLVPDLTVTESEKGTFNLLVIGSTLVDDNAVANVFGKLYKQAKGGEYFSSYVTKDTFVINLMTDEKNDYGLRNTLASTDWDAIVIQLSRRCTPAALDVETSELNALKTILPLLTAETDKIFILTIPGAANPATFTTEGGNINYTKNGKTETLTALQTSQYFGDFAKRLAAGAGISGSIPFGEATFEMANSTKASRGYLEACMLYMALYGEKLPDSVTETNGLSAEEAAALRQLAEKYCLKTQ